MSGKRGFWTHVIIRGLVWTAAICPTIACYAQPSDDSDQLTGYYYDLLTELQSSYIIPAFARIDAVNVTGGSSTTATVTLRAIPPNPIADRMMVEVYFTSQIAVVFSVGSHTLGTAPPLGPGQAAVVRLSDRVVLGPATANVNAATVTITCNSALLDGGAYADTAIRFLPASVDINRVAGSLGSCIADAAIANTSTAVPHFTTSYALYSEAEVDLQGRIPIDLPRGPGYWCPPLVPRPDVTKPADMDGNGIPDWDYPGDKKVPGTNVIVGVFGLDRPPAGNGPIWRKGANGEEGWHYDDAYRIGVGIDTNGNNKLDPSEVLYWIGMCPFDGGRNTWWFEKHGSTWYVHCKSVEPGTGRVRHYIYNTSTGILKVFVEGKNEPVYNAPASQYTGFGPLNPNL